MKPERVAIAPIAANAVAVGNGRAMSAAGLGSLRRLSRALRLAIASKPWAWGGLASFAFLYFMLFVPPCTPIFVAGGDASVFLTEGIRIAQGQVIYRDFFEFTAPGAPMLYGLLIKLFGPRAWIPNTALMALGMGFACMSIVLAQRLVSGAAVLLPGFLFLGIALHGYLDASHHWYSTLLTMAATAVLAGGRGAPRLVLAGTLCGMASCFTQGTGIAATAGFAAFIFWEKSRDGEGLPSILRAEVWLLASAAAVVATCGIYFTLRVGAAKLVDCLIVFPFKYWSSFPPNRFRKYLVIDVLAESVKRHKPVWLTVIGMATLMPAIYFVVLNFHLRYPEPNLTPQRRSAILVNTLGLFLFASVLNSATYTRIYTVSLPAFLVLVWLANQPRWSNTISAALLWAVALIFLTTGLIRTQTHQRAYLETSGGWTAFTWPHQNLSLYRWLLANTRLGDYVFEAEWPDAYFPLGLQNPTQLSFLTTCEFTRPEQVREVIGDLQRRQVRLILWGDDLDPFSECTLTSDHLSPLRDYLRSHYTRIKDLVAEENISIWSRNAER